MKVKYKFQVKEFEEFFLNRNFEVISDRDFAVLAKMNIPGCY
jgi:hypothetical protein